MAGSAIQVTSINTWAANTQTTPKVMTFPAATTPGNVVVVFINFSHDDISSVTGQGATWSIYKSRDGGNTPFMTAAIAVGQVVTAGTTVTFTPVSTAAIDPGRCWAVELAGVSATPSSTHTEGVQSLFTASYTTTALACNPGDVYLCGMSAHTTTAPPTITDSPSAFDLDRDGTPGTFTWEGTGYRIAATSETPSRTFTWSSSFFKIGVALVLPTGGQAVGLVGVSHGIAGVAGDLAAPGPRQLGTVVDGVATVVATVTVQPGLIGTITATAAQTAVLIMQYALVGTVTGAATVTGLVGYLLPLQSQINGTSAANANLSVRLALSGPVAGLAAITADLHITRGLNVATRGRAIVVANLAGARALNGSAAGMSGSTALLGISYALTGTANAAASVTADITRLALMSGQIDGFSQVITGYLGLQLPLAGEAVGAASTTAALTGTLIRLTGRSDGLASDNARLTLFAVMAARSDGVATDVAAITVYELLASSVHGTSTVAAGLGVHLTLLSGHVNGVATATAALSGIKVQLVGRSDGRATVVGALGGIVGELTGRIDGVAHVTANLIGAKPVNDNFANATLLSGTGGTLGVATSGATLEVGEPDAAGRTDTVWYHLVAPGEGTLTVDTSATTPTWPSVVDVFTGTALANLVLVGSEDVTYQGVAEAGDVWIRVSSTSPRTIATLTWSFDLYAPLPPNPYFTVDDPVLDYTPTVVLVTLGNLTPDETVSVEVDNTILLPDTITVDDAANAGPTALHIPALTDGDHILTAVTSIGRVDVTLTVSSEGVDMPTPLATPPSAVPQTGVVRWVFQDPTPSANPAQYVVPINPNKMTTPFGERNITSEGTTAVDGKTLMWEGITQPVQWQFSGVILNQDHYDALETWSLKKNRIYIIDHYGRGWECYPKKFDPEPERAIGKPWKHTYTFTVLITRGPVTPQ